jgi:hypothetical protein
MLLLLVMHLMVHPVVHGLAALSLVSQPHSVTVPLNGDLGSSRSTTESCDLCRVGQSLTALPALTRTQLLNPQWVPVRLQVVFYASLQVAPGLPSRAPPSI